MSVLWRFSCAVLSARWDTVMASSGCLNTSSRIWSNAWPCSLLEFSPHFLHSYYSYH
ncbi:hypothetical protein OIU78_005043 [Salix suchowensis]|nr:hypothetical protein OIU78_005043 [Salix suchowensis]